VKTISLKKVAAVAVASLGFGLLSVVPVQAAEHSASLTTSINLAKSSSNLYTTGSTVTVSMGAVTVAGGSTADTAKYAGVLTAYPAGGFVQVSAVASAAGSTGMLLGASQTATGATLTVVSLKTATVTANTAGTTYAAQYSFVPTVAGAYTLTVFNDADADGTIDPTETRQTTDVTITAAAGYSASLSTLYLGTGTTAATSATDLLPVSASKTAGTVAANIRVAIKNTAGNVYTGQTVTATVAGPGLLAGATNAAADTAHTAVGTARAVEVTDTNGYVSFTLASDGTSGTGVVTISVTDKVSLATTVLGTKSVVFYGSVAKIVATANYTILKAGGGVTGGSVSGSTATNYLDLANRVNATDVPAVIVKATDSSGNVVGGLTILGLSSDTTVANSWSVVGADDANGCKEDVLSAANVYSSGGTGFYNCALSTPTTATSGKTAKITFRVSDPADVTGVAYLTSDVTITTGGTTPGTETITFDKTSYAPGEAMNVTRTCKDTSGNACADGTTAPAITFSKAVGGTAPAASTYVGGKRSSTSSTGVASVYAPVIGGAFSANATSGNAAGSAVTASASVTDANAGLLTQIDALNAKIVALNALIAKIMKKLGVK
jgi:hypothetical protein